MENDFRIGASVICTDGDAGKLRHLVLDPATEAVTHLVVDSAAHFGIPVLVPRDRVASASEDEIRLRCTQDELRTMDPYEAPVYSGGADSGGLANPIPAPYDYPGGGLGLTPMAGIAGPLGTPATPPIMEAVVPAGEVVIDPDSTVEATDGEIGRVEEAQTDPATGRLSHIVVRHGHFWNQERRRLPASAIARVEEGLVRLNLSRDQVAALPASGDAPAPAPQSAPSVTSAAPGATAVPIAGPGAEMGAAVAPRSVAHLAGLFATREQAEAAVDALIAGGFPSDDIAAVTAEGRSLAFPTTSEAAWDRGGRNTAIGAVVGAIAGFAIFGPLLLAFGAVAGGVIGLLTTVGATTQQAEYLSERVRAGHYLVIVRPNDRVAEATSILENAGAAEVHPMAGADQTPRQPR